MHIILKELRSSGAMDTYEPCAALSMLAKIAQEYVPTQAKGLPSTGKAHAV